MNVLFLRSDVAFAGPGVLALRIGCALMEQGHTVRIATSGGEMVDRFEEAGIAVDIVPELAISARGALNTWRAMCAIRSIVRRRSIDVMHSFNAHAAMSGEFARLTTSARLVHTVLGTGKEWMNQLHRAPIAAVSRSTAANLEAAGVAPSRIRVMPPLSIGEDFVLGGEALASVVAARRARRTCRFVSVAMFTGNKGQEQLIAHFAQAFSNGEREAELVLVGDGATRRACEELATSMGVADRILFAGARHEVASFLDDADVFVHHAASETFGMVFVEAGARALPTIAADVGGISDIVQDQITGVLVPFDSLQGFTEAMQAFADDRDDRERMGEAARQRIRERFVKEAILPAYLALYAGT